MSEFRAKLRAPKRSMWLGCKVKEVISKTSQVSGRPYLQIRFENCPFIATWTQFHQQHLILALAEKGYRWPDNAIPIYAGDLLHLDVRWEVLPDREGRIYPRPFIDIGSFVLFMERFYNL